VSSADPLLCLLVVWSLGGSSSLVVRPQLNTSPSYPLTTPNVVPFGIQTLVDVRLANGTKVTLAASNACPTDTPLVSKSFPDGLKQKFSACKAGATVPTLATEKEGIVTSLLEINLTYRFV
jgi:hypothetical protein